IGLFLLVLPGEAVPKGGGLIVERNLAREADGVAAPSGRRLRKPAAEIVGPHRRKAALLRIVGELPVAPDRRRVDLRGLVLEAHEQPEPVEIHPAGDRPLDLVLFAHRRRKSLALACERADERAKLAHLGRGSWALRGRILRPRGRRRPETSKNERGPDREQGANHGLPPIFANVIPASWDPAKRSALRLLLPDPRRRRRSARPDLAHDEVGEHLAPELVEVAAIVGVDGPVLAAKYLGRIEIAGQRELPAACDELVDDRPRL